MGILNQDISGLLLEDYFNDLSAWTVGSGWTVQAKPGYVCYPTSRVLLDRIPSGAPDSGGLREPNLIIGDNGTWYLFYDAGDGTTGPSSIWHVHLATSTDRGITWTRLGPQTLNHGSTIYTTYVAFTLAGWIVKSAGVFYSQILNAQFLIAGRVPGLDYTNSVYTATALTGPWTWLNDSPPKSIIQFEDTTNTLSFVFFDGTQWVGYYSARSDSGVYNIGRATTPNLNSPWVEDGLGAVLPASVIFDFGAIENPKIWFSSFLNSWIMIGNNNVAESTDLWIAPTEADFRTSNCNHIRIQHKFVPLDTRNTISVSAPLAREDNTIIQSANGQVAFVYGGDWDAGSPNDYEWHRIRVGYLEPSNNVAYFSGAAGNVYLTRSFTTQDFVAEFSAEPHATNSHTSFVYRFLNGSSDTLSSGYVLDINHNASVVGFYKLATGTFTQLGSLYNFSYNCIGNDFNSNTVRIKVVVSGSHHQIYIGGALAMDVTDSTYAGTLIGFRATTGPLAIRHFYIRNSDTVTVNGTNNGDVVTLRGYGGYPIATTTSSGSSVIFSLPYGRAESIDIGGSSFIPNAGIIGGDSYTFSEPPPPPPDITQKYLSPKITFQVYLVNYSNILSSAQPDNNLDNIIYGLSQSSIQIPGVLGDQHGNLHNGDTFILYGQQALYVKKNYSNFLQIISTE